MPYFIDGDNLIGHLRRERPETEDRAALVAELCDRLRQTRARVVLFFDGPPPDSRSALGGLSIRFSGTVSADDVIVREIDRAAAAGEIVLVTADRELGRRARDAGAKTCAPGAFWERFGRGRAPSSGAPRSVDVQDWVRFFEDERNRLE